MPKTIQEVYNTSPGGALTGDEIWVGTVDNVTKGWTTQEIVDFVEAGILQVPSGGSTDYVLTKNSGTSGDYSWKESQGGAGANAIFAATVGFSDADYICDGTDDDVQIQAAMDAVDAAGGGTVYIKAGTYNTTSEITVWSNTQVVGAGRGATNINPKGIPTAQYVFAFTTDYPNPGNEDITFRDMSILGMFTHGSFISGSFGVNPSRNGIRASNVKRVLIDNMYFEECSNATTIGLNQYFADLGPRNVQQVSFRNNYCYRCLGGLQGYSQESIIWDGNQFEYIADDPMAFLMAENETSGTSKAIVVNNIVQHGVWYNDNGIEGLGTLFKVDGGPFGSETIDQVIVSNNIAEDLDFGLYVNAYNRLIATNNIISTTNRSGMYLIGSSDKTIVTGNMIINPNTSANGTQGGIYGVSTTNISIYDNQFYGTNTGSKQGINLESALENVMIARNQFTDIDNTVIYCETSDGASIIDNQFFGTFSTLIRFGGDSGWIADNNMLNATYTTAIALGTITNTQIGHNPGYESTRTVTGVTGFSNLFKLTYCNAAGGSFYFGSLPAASTNIGREYTMMKTDTTTNTVQILPSGSDTIGGQTSFFLRFPNESVTFKARDAGGGAYDWEPLYNWKAYRTTVNGTTVYTVTHNLGRFVTPTVIDGTSGALIPFNESAGVPYATGYRLASITVNSFQITVPSGAVTYTIVCV